MNAEKHPIRKIALTPHECLLLYQDTVEHLRHHPYSRFVRARNGKLTATWDAPGGPPRSTKSVRPSEAVISSYCGVLRGFFLSTDEWTIDRLPQVYHALGASGFWKYHLKKARKELALWKKQPTKAVIPWRPNTKWAAFELYVYGQAVHRTQSTDLKRIRKDKFFYEYFLLTLTGILEELHHFVVRIYHLNHWVQWSLRPAPKLP